VLDWADCAVPATAARSAKRLETLLLQQNRIDDVRPLGKLRGLRTLRLDGNRVATVAPLASLVNLEDLDLSDNELKDLKVSAAGAG
jgi:internalin A